jgi:hypothetical protein
MATMMYVITNLAGEIVSVSQQPRGGRALAGIRPGADQKMYLLSNVDRDLLSIAQPDRFHDAITEHFRSGGDKEHIEEPDIHIHELIQRHCRSITDTRS